MAKIIAFANQKGGVGKTTTAVNLTAALSEMGKRVLLCDFDPQGNATSGVGVDPRRLETTVYDLILEEEPDVRKAIVKTKWADVLGSNTELAGAEIDLISMPEREYRLQRLLKEVSGDYDYIMIDCPPSLGILTLNCLCAADAFLVPLQCEYYALEGLSQLMNTVRAVQKGLNKGIRLEGVLLTMFDGRTNLSIQVVEEVKKHFGDKVYSTVVPRMYGSAKHPAMASRSPLMTAIAGARKLIRSLQRNSLRKTENTCKEGEANGKNERRSGERAWVAVWGCRGRA